MPLCYAGLIMLFMSDAPDSSRFKMIPISEIQVGQNVVNLGPVIEIENKKSYYNLIIARVNEKQVIRFNPDVVLLSTT